MPIQFLDSRLSLPLSDSEGTERLPRTPLLLGDIGLETAIVTGTPNQSDIRVSLWGTIGVSGDLVAQSPFMCKEAEQISLILV